MSASAQHDPTIWDPQPERYSTPVTPHMCQRHQDIFAEGYPSIKDLCAAGGDFETIRDSVSQLTNEVHPLFRIRPYKDKGREGLPLDQKDMLPTLQLASLMLKHPTSLSFFHGMLSMAAAEGFLVDGKAKERTFQNDFSRANEPFVVRRFRATKHMTRTQIAETMQLLDALAETLAFYPVFSYHGDPHAMTSLVTVESSEKFEHKYDDDKQQWVGLKDGVWGPVDFPFVHLTVNNTNLIKPLKDWQRPDSPLSILEVRHYYFHTAATICHELAHAVYKHFWADKVEAFFEDEPVAEVGFAWDNFVLGGHYMHSYTPEILIQEWPCKALTSAYSMQAHHGLPTDGEVPGEVVVARVDEGRLEQMFSQEFWKEGQTESLKLPMCCALVSEEIDLRRKELNIPVREPSAWEAAFYTGDLDALRALAAKGISG